jgi:hypothetical protein
MNKNYENMSTEELLKLYNAENKSSSTKNHAKTAAKYAGFIPRALAAAPGYLSDFVNLPTHLVGRGLHWAAGIPYQEHPGHGEQIKQTIDTLTKNKIKPNTPNQLIAERALDASLGRKLPWRTRIAGGIGGVTSQAIENKIPEDTATSIGAGIATSLLTKKSLERLAQNKGALSRIKSNPYIKQKTIEKIGEHAGSHDLSKVTNEQMGRLAQKASHGYNKRSQENFQKLFGRSKSLVNKYTENHTNENRFIPTSDTIKHFIDKYNELGSPALKQQYLQSPIGKQVGLLLGVKGKDRIKQFDEVLSNNDIMNGAVTPIKDADRIKRLTGNLLSKKETIGSEDEKELSSLYGKLTNDIEKFHEKISPRALRLHKAAKKQYKLHQEKNVPHVNAITAHKHAPAAAAHESIKDLHLDANPTRFVSENLKGKHREKYHKGIAFELGKKGNIWDPIEFEKNISELPATTQKLVIGGLSNHQQSLLNESNQLVRSLKTLENKSHAWNEILPKFVKIPKKIYSDVTSEMKKSPSQIEKGYQALKRTIKKPEQKNRLLDYTHQGDMGVAARQYINSQKPHDLESLSTEELLDLYNS